MSNDKAVVDAVLRSRNNYYNIFGLDRSADEAKIKSAYKKLALKCHPDKNTDPRASEAFKVVTKAHQVLSDSQKRRAYDRGGEEGVMHQESGSPGPRTGNPYQRQAYHNPHGGADAFEEFIFHAFGGAQQRRQGGHRGQQHNVQMEGNLGLLMLLPMLVFFLMAGMLSSNVFEGGNSGSSRGQRYRETQPFALAPNEKDGFTIMRTTSLRDYYDLRVDYYVKRSFDELLYRGQVDLRGTELEVLRAKRDSLSRRCNADKLRARSRKDDSLPDTCREHRRFQRVR